MDKPTNKKTIRWEKKTVVEYPIEVDCTLRELSKKTGIHFAHLSKIFNGFVIPESTAKKIVDAIYTKTKSR